MGLTTALTTSLNGLALNETTIDVLGHNIANSGTRGFKAGEALFTTQLSRTLAVGSRPTGTNGGTNPRQVGLGAVTSTIRKDFTQGSVTTSTSPSDLAIQGDGFFVLQNGNGVRYTRDGSFTLNADSRLVNPQGAFVQGYGIDENFQLVTTELTDLRIPLGELNIAERTENVALSGALLPTGRAATRGALLNSDVLTDAGGPITDASLLEDLRDGGGNALFTPGETLSFSGRKGGRQLDAETLPVVGGSTTLGELMSLMGDALGIQTDAAVPADGTTGDPPGVELVAGRIRLTGNQGTVNDLNVSLGDLTSDGTAVSLNFTKAAAADGESAITDYVVYDSLGEAVRVKMTAVLESRTPTSTNFRWYVDSDDDSARSSAVGTGLLTFDGEGNVSAGETGTYSLNRDDTAAISPMQVTVDFSRISGLSSETSGSSISLDSQDGSPPGTLTSFLIDEGGVINGVFDNGLLRPLGQVALARFNNAQGLLQQGGGTFGEGVSSGPPFLTEPGTFGAGTLRSGAIELSNTDIGRNLVDLIVASTNYRGNARVISSVQQLVDELLVLGR